MKKAILGIVSMLFLIGAAGCGSEKQTASVRYWNTKPEVADVWEKIADEYYAETGVEVEIINPPTNSSDSTIKSAMAKRNPPTLFKLSGQTAYNDWKAYCRDLSDTDLYSWVVDKSMVVTDESGNGAYAIPYVVEGYGIIYNDEIMQRYFSLGSKSTSYNSMAEINNFDKLKEVVEDMTAHKSELGIKGVFASTSFACGEDWRWQTHLMNMPIYAEYADKNIVNTDNLEFTYSENYKNIFDLYLDNSVCDRKDIGSVTVDQSMAEFARGECAMVQNGNWGWGQISSSDGNIVTEENCKYLPIYTGLPNDEEQGLCIGTENYVVVNTLASEEDQLASIAFLEWLYSSDVGKSYVTNELQFITVFNTFSASEAPSNPLAVEVSSYLNDTSKSSVPWNFTSFPGQEFKDGLSDHLYAYATGQEGWEKVDEYVVQKWAEMKSGE